MLNMEKLYRWVILFLKLCLITVCKIMLRHFTNKGMESRVSKLIIKRCIWLNFIGKGRFLRDLYYMIWKNRMLPPYLAAQQQNKLSQFPVCVCCCAFELKEFRRRLVRSTYKPDFPFSNSFVLGYLQQPEMLYVMFI